MTCSLVFSGEIVVNTAEIEIWGSTPKRRQGEAMGRIEFKLPVVRYAMDAQHPSEGSCRDPQAAISRLLPILHSKFLTETSDH